VRGISFPEISEMAFVPRAGALRLHYPAQCDGASSLPREARRCEWVLRVSCGAEERRLRSHLEQQCLI
jgi:hypothetical protein